MDGYVAYDFGDAIRTIINTTTEDEADLSKIQLNMPLFDAYVQGYLKKLGSFWTDVEVNSLMKGALLLPYMQAVRFLTDHYHTATPIQIKLRAITCQREGAVSAGKNAGCLTPRRCTKDLNEMDSYKTAQYYGYSYIGKYPYLNGFDDLALG